MKELDLDRSYRIEPLLDDEFEILIRGKHWEGFLYFDDVDFMKDEDEDPEEFVHKDDRVEVEDGYVYWLPLGVPEELEGKSSYTDQQLEEGFLTIELILSAKDPDMVTTPSEDYGIEDKIPVYAEVIMKGKTFYSLGEVLPPGEYAFADEDAWTVKHKLNWYQKGVDGVSGPILVPKADPSEELVPKPTKDTGNLTLILHEVKDLKTLKLQWGSGSNLLEKLSEP